ncbi:MAG: glycosyltransferase family 2 protein [Patescibacteria group bacterium]
MENKSEIKLSAVIPIYNEEAVVAGVIEDLKGKLSELNIEHEIIAVNDGSSDQSGFILEKIDGIKLINHPVNRGYGASLKTGIKNSRYDWILIIDADGTYPTAAISELLAEAGQYDLVVGSRQKKGNAIPPNRRLAKKFLNWFAGYLAGGKIPDLNSGLRIFRKKIVFEYWDLFPSRFSFSSTLTMICLTHGYETVFLPIDYYRRQGNSSLRSKDFFGFIRLVVKLSLFFKPLKVFIPISLFLLVIALLLGILFFAGVIPVFLDTTITILGATALQTFFFGLLAEIFIHNKN